MGERNKEKTGCRFVDLLLVDSNLNNQTSFTSVFAQKTVTSHLTASTTWKSSDIYSQKQYAESQYEHYFHWNKDVKVINYWYFWGCLDWIFSTWWISIPWTFDLQEDGQAILKTVRWILMKSRIKYEQWAPWKNSKDEIQKASYCVCLWPAARMGLLLLLIHFLTGVCCLFSALTRLHFEQLLIRESALWLWYHTEGTNLMNTSLSSSLCWQLLASIKQHESYHWIVISDVDFPAAPWPPHAGIVFRNHVHLKITLFTLNIPVYLTGKVQWDISFQKHFPCIGMNRRLNR